MRIMSLNAWGGRVFEPLVAYLSAADPDVLCLQEVVHTPTAAKDWLTYRDKTQVLPQRARFFADIQAVLPGHNGFFAPAAQGDLWDGDMRVDSQWGLATFVRKSLPIVGERIGFVHKSFSPHGYGAHPRSRNAHAVRLYDFEKDHAVTIAHMHGLRDPHAAKKDTPERRAQAQRFAELVRSVAEPGDRLVVGGDFNVLPDSETLAILAQLGLTELVTAHGHEGTRTSHYEKPQRFADYMLVSDDLAGAPFAVIRDPEVSDHCPMLLETI